MKAMLLFVVVLIAPVNSFAHETTSWASTNECACHLLPTSHYAEERENQPVQSPDTPVDGCCDEADCCPDAGETPISCAVRAKSAVRLPFHPKTDRYIPEVYLAIFVPPENQFIPQL
jgi:hypothetical protein